MEVKVASFNILNTSCRYEERKHMLQEAISSLKADLIGLQEVNFSGNSEVLSLESYELKISFLPDPKLKDTEPNFRIDGNAVLLEKNFRVIEEDTLVYNSKLRIAHKLLLEKQGNEFWFVNTHLDNLNESTRVEQVQQLVEWLRPCMEKCVIVTGDFNFIPGSPAYSLMSEYFNSALKESQGVEPALTCPSGLFGTHADLDKHGCFDYIWVKNCKVTNGEVLYSIGSGDLCASDHFPIFTKVLIS